MLIIISCNSIYFSVSFGNFPSDKFDIGFNYELWIPEGVDLQGSSPGLHQNLFCTNHSNIWIFIKFSLCKLLQLSNKKIDVSTGSLPLIIEIYGGPGSTKVTASWKRSWTQTYMCSHHNGKFRFLYISNSNFDSKQSWILQKFLYNLNLCRNLPKL